MKIYSVNDAEFQNYGKVLEGYDFSELFEQLAKVAFPKDGIEYVASVKCLEDCKEKALIQARGFGGMDVQIGFCSGKNSKLNCLEYHKNSEFNIALDDIILILGKEEEIKDGVFDTALCKAFLLPAGVGVELYATALHYAPINLDENGFRVICVLPKGTNGPKFDFPHKNKEDDMSYGTNKWLLAHKEALDDAPGAYIGLVGKNLTVDDLEK